MKWLNKSTRSQPEQEDVNPMNYMGNLSDVMLVLAVGMMLALVIAWNVDIANGSPSAQTLDPARMEELTEEIDALQTADDTDKDTVSVEDYGLTEYGMVYVDADGNYYVLEAQGDGQ